MDIYDGRVKEIRFFLLRLGDCSLIDCPWLIILCSENQAPAIRAKGNGALLTRRIRNPFCIAMLDRCDINIAPNNERDFFAIWAKRHLCRIIPESLDPSGCQTIVQTYLDINFL